METLDLKVDGMTCQSCTRAVERALRNVPGVDGVDVRLDAGTATVRGEGVVAMGEAFKAALGAAGYEARPPGGAPAARQAPNGGCGSGRASGGGCCCGH